MGRVHQIKRQFGKLVDRDPFPIGNHWLAKGVSVYTGKRWDGSTYIGQFSSYKHPYNALIKRLIRDYEQTNRRGVALSDRASVGDVSPSHEVESAG